MLHLLQKGINHICTAKGTSILVALEEQLIANKFSISASTFSGLAHLAHKCQYKKNLAVWYITACMVAECTIRTI